MLKVVTLTVALYLCLELLCHTFAYYVSWIFKKSALKQGIEHRQDLVFIRDIFYRIMLLISIVLLNHVYTEKIFYEINPFIRYFWAFAFTSFIVLILWWLNALIIQSTLIKQNQKQSFNATYKQKISYILLHPKEFLHLYTATDYLEKSKYLNYLLSMLAFILLFFDIQLLFNA
ncbi:hypothetical protein [Acinetobacter sp. Marseille-Q1618]|uniref:hypothetical protein n=1 Tax=Acinetobacter sp. Marseille-Q1618 TaxID=2697502 RepID=UPI001570F83F|nr:hypothetical protein [Acinetobacter sp. Marseille-Q1618]